MRHSIFIQLLQGHYSVISAIIFIEIYWHLKLENYLARVDNNTQWFILGRPLNESLVWWAHALCASVLAFALCWLNSLICFCALMSILFYVFKECNLLYLTHWIKLMGMFMVFFMHCVQFMPTEAFQSV